MFPPEWDCWMQASDENDGGLAEDAVPDEETGPVTLSEHATADDDRRLGMKLRARRFEQKLSLHQLSAKCGLSVGMLSQIERGLSSPSLRSLRVLSIALTVPMSWFFAAPEQPPKTSSPYIVRRLERRLLRLTPTGVMKELLSHASPSMFEMYELMLQPGGSSGAEFFRHEGEKAGMVLSGKLRLFLDDEPHVLEQGDSFQFPSTLSHQFDNPGSTPARVLWITAPPFSAAIGTRSSET